MSNPNGKVQVKTYEQLRDEADAHWREVSAARQGKFTSMMESILNSPDVKMKPDPEQPWSCEGIDCPDCGWSTFNVDLWVTINGIKHRFQATCRQCGSVHTWDWNINQWVA